MRRLSRFALLTALLIPLMGALFGTEDAAHADTRSSARKQVLAEYARYDKIANQADGKNWLRWYQQTTTPDYTEKQVSGKVSSRAQVLEAMQWGSNLAGASNGIKISGATRLTRLVVRGKTAMADTRSRKNVRQPARSGALVVVEEKRDTWVSTERGWKLKRREVRLSEIWADGKLQSARRLGERSHSSRQK